jgi:uncharacterized repeat protein (TIGR01451 family)
MRAAFCLCLLFTGCFGVSQNPSYFPYYLPSGDIIRTHAKPPGAGYFKNFDPKACKIEVVPANAMNPTKTQVVLVATVYDKDGDARRKRRVEWQLEGPGTIVEVDESGYFDGRGYQVTDKYAVSYTDMFTHTITRGHANTNDEFTICAGQSWCVVSSPVEGQTIVTAYAPEVYDWDKRRAFAKLVWSDGGFQPAVRSGRETDSSLLERAKAEAPLGTAGLVLDLKLAKTVALNREATAIVTLANAGKAASSTATVRAVIPNGVDLARADPAPSRRSGSDLYWNVDAVAAGQSRDIALVLRPTKSGAFTLVAAAETPDGLKASTKADSIADTAGMKVTVEGPSFAAAGESAAVKITVSNPGNVPIENAVAWLTPDAGLNVPGGTSPLEVRVGTITPGQSRSVDATLAAEKTGKFPVRVDVTADGGLSARGEGTVTVGKAELMVRVVGPESVPVGDAATYEVQVVNGGDAAVSDVNVKATLPRGLSAKGSPSDGGSVSTDGVAWKLASLAPGEKKVFRLAAGGDQLSELGSVTATANGTLTGGGKLPAAKTSAPVAVRGLPVLVLEHTAPTGTVAVGGKLSYRVTVRNSGSGPARDVAVSADLSDELRATRADKATVADHRVTFAVLPELAAGASATFTLDAEALSAGDARVNVAVQSRDLPSALKEEQATRITPRK